MGVNFFSFMIILVMTLGFSAVITGEDRQLNSPTTVDSLDLQRYTGLWYEIARLPNRFQKKCIKNTTASYRLLPNGKIEVVNRCLQADGKAADIKGIAKVVDPVSNSRLKVSFFRPLGISLFWGDYWVIGLGEDYEYAVVGTPDRKYGWILARQSRLEQAQLDKIFDLLQRQGYQPADFVMTPQEY